jgi:hemerythrin-like domain-containing protein
MSTAIDDLKHEHEAIRFTLKVLAKMAEQSERGNADDADRHAIIAFLREFADKCHHGKEEGILFPEMEQAGIVREGGPLGVMLSEHVQGRELIAAMESALQSADGSAFSKAARDYIRLLDTHIWKENEVLFPMAENAINAGDFEDIYDRFEEHEEKVIGHGRHEQLHAMLDAFEEKYLKGA